MIYLDKIPMSVPGQGDYLMYVRRGLKVTPLNIEQFLVFFEAKID